MRKTLAVLLVLWAVPAWAGTHPAASCSAAHVQDAMDAATEDGAIVTIPACSGASAGHWTVAVTWTAPPNAQLLGAGSLTTTGGGDATVIIDDYAGSGSMLAITANASGTLRIAGITIQGGTGALKNLGVFRVIGGTQTRIDHVHFNAQTYTTADPRNGSRIFEMSGYGVLDHAILDLYFNSAIYVTNGGGPDGQGNLVWSQPTGFGGASFFYIEDSVINGNVATSPSRILDCLNQGSRVVVRFNTLGYTSGPESHATGSSWDNRGCRAKETYGNHFVQLPSQPGPAYDMHDGSNGTHLVWGNTADSGTLTNGILFHVTRRNNATYGQETTPYKLGFCGTSFWSATVNTSGTAVHATAFPNSAGWLGGSGQQTYSVRAGGLINIAGTQYTIASVTDADDLVLTESAGTQTGAASYIVSNWDGAPSTDSGYPCMDQTGRGQGDLLSGTVPNLVNQTNGNATHTSPNAWPRQALEPVYIWKNTLTVSGGSWYDNPFPANVQADRDYYAQASGMQTTQTSPFNGTTGTGWGTLANRPATCTTGVGYFATDQGSWNGSATNPYGVQQSGADGVLYTCTATNTWTLYYTPYTYPHPLASAGTPPNAPTNVRIR